MKRLVLAGLALTAGCGHAIVVSQAMASMNAARAAPAVREAASLAPQPIERAEAERRLAEESEAHGDGVSADLHAEAARVLYDRAVALTRLARAEDQAQAAAAADVRLTDEASRLAAARSEFDHAAEVTAAELAVARAAAEKAPIRAADPGRERARLVAARSLAAEGELLCGAAELLVQRTPAAAPSSDAPRVEAASRSIASLAGSLEHRASPHEGAELDAAASSRAACLDALTRVRRATGGPIAGAADALLAELAARGGWSPSRDERGVVVTLRDVFKGTAVARDLDKQLRELGRVAAAHPAFPVQIVVHDASVPSAGEHAGDVERGRAALALLTSSGITQPTSVETMGAAFPVTDPDDARTRARNARLEVVFVSPSD